ncbi:MAG: hypothetical protein V8S76_05595 [Lachnospiraceae bacterium]
MATLRSWPTSVIALVLFHEKISARLWGTIALITLSSIILSFEGSGSMEFSLGSLLVLAATVCWGLENNCTRNISSKSTYQIVTIKGFFPGMGSFVIALFCREPFPQFRYILLALLLGYVAYGLSIFTYIRAQKIAWRRKDKHLLCGGTVYRTIFVLCGTRGKAVDGLYLAALLVMAGGTALVIVRYACT